MLILEDIVEKPIFSSASDKFLRSFDILGWEGRRETFYTAKYSEWPHLYKTYEATYVIKCLFSRILAKNCLPPQWKCIALSESPTLYTFLLKYWAEISIPSVNDTIYLIYLND